jgi:hypothetical protein
MLTLILAANRFDKPSWSREVLYALIGIAAIVVIVDQLIRFF